MNNIMQLEEKRRQEIVQNLIYDNLLMGLHRKIEYHYDPKIQTPQVLVQGPVFIGLLKHDDSPTDATLDRFLGKVVGKRGHRVAAATRCENNTPGVNFTLHKPQSAKEKHVH